MQRCVQFQDKCPDLGLQVRYKSRSHGNHAGPKGTCFAVENLSVDLATVPCCPGNALSSASTLDHTRGYLALTCQLLEESTEAVSRSLEAELPEDAVPWLRMILKTELASVCF